MRVHRTIANAAIATAFLISTSMFRAQDNLSAPSSQPATVQQSSTSRTAPQQGVVTVGKLVSNVPPVYPPIAKAAHVQGTVVIHAVIGKDGTVNSPTVISGPPLLQQAALDAVSQWKYQPYTLNGAPAEVDTTLNVVFSLDGAEPSQEAQTSEPTDPVTQEKLGEDFENGTNGKPQDDIRAVYWYRKAAEQNFAVAQRYLGSMYYLGRGGLTKDDFQALFWFRKSAEQGDAIAEANLGVFCEEGRGGLTKDDGQAANWYEKAAEQGSMEAQGNLGRFYMAGRGGVARNESLAVVWFRKAAEHGHPRSQFDLGVMYEKGLGGLSPDITEAIYWYRKAAVQGFAEATTALSRLDNQVELPQHHQRDSFADGQGQQAVTTNPSVHSVIEEYRNSLKEPPPADYSPDALEAEAASRRSKEEASARQEAARKGILVDSPARATARRQHAAIVQSQLQRVIGNARSPHTLQVFTETPGTWEGLSPDAVRQDYRLTIQANGVMLPRDVTALLRNRSLNSEAQKLGFTEIAIQDAINQRIGMVTCAVALQKNGAHPAYCLVLDRASDMHWSLYYKWPRDFVVHDDH